MWKLRLHISQERLRYDERGHAEYLLEPDFPKRVVVCLNRYLQSAAKPVN
jgi:hypothetical protein